MTDMRRGFFLALTALVIWAWPAAAQEGPAEDAEVETPDGVPAAEGEAASDDEAAAELFDDEGRPILDRMLDRLDDLYRSDSSVSRMRLEVVRPRRTVTFEMRSWTLGTERALIIIDRPARHAGTATLKVERNLWNYLPRISRTIRIPPSMMMDSWMGSDLSNDDLVRDASLADDYESELVGRSEDPEGWLVNLTAREDAVGLWRRIEYVISPDATLPVEARFFDRRGELARIMRFLDVREFGGRRIPSRLEIEPVDEEGHMTVMTYLDIDFEAEVPPATFSLQRLERGR